MPNQKWTYHGDGVVSKLHRVHHKRKKRDPDLKRYFYAQFWHKGKRHTQQAGTTEKQALTLLAKITADRDAAKREKREWFPPSVQAEREAAEAKREARAEAEAAEAAKALILENVVDRFKAAHLEDYANPANTEHHLRMIVRYFTGRRLDTLKRSDVRAYITDRLGHVGVFEGTTGGVRAAQSDIAFLSRLFVFLQDDEEREVDNPCSNSFRHRTKAQKYKPEHKAIVPDDAEWATLIDEAETMAAQGVKRGDVARKLPAFLQLTYYTAARPESESCQLLHGDVGIPDRSNVHTTDGAPVLGTVTYRDLKTGEAARTMPLHPAAEAALVAIMEPKPDDSTEFDAWAARPVFARADGTPWTVNSYRRRWSELRTIVAKTHPRLSEMWVRDLRPAAITNMREAGADRAQVAKIAGHSERMSDHYTKLTDQASRDAILKLRARQVAA